MPGKPTKTANGESEEFFSVTSSVLLGIVDDRPLVAKLKEHQVVIAPADDPAKELVHTPVKEAYERIATAATLTREQLNEIYKQHQVQSQNWFRISIITAFVGFLVVLGGVVSMFTGYINAGLVSAAVGAVSEVIAALFYRQANAANHQLRIDLSKLINSERIHQAIELVLTIDDTELRDQLKVSIIRLALHDNRTISEPDNRKGVHQ